MPQIIDKERFEDVDDELGYSYIGYYFKMKSGNTFFALTKYDDEQRIIITEPWEVNFKSDETLNLLKYIKHVMYDESIEIWHPGNDGYEPAPV